MSYHQPHVNPRSEHVLFWPYPRMCHLWFITLCLFTRLKIKEGGDLGRHQVPLALNGTTKHLQWTEGSALDPLGFAAQLKLHLAGMKGLVWRWEQFHIQAQGGGRQDERDPKGSGGEIIFKWKFSVRNIQTGYFLARFWHILSKRKPETFWREISKETLLFFFTDIFHKTEIYSLTDYRVFQILHPNANGRLGALTNISKSSGPGLSFYFHCSCCHSCQETWK